MYVKEEYYRFELKMVKSGQFNLTKSGQFGVRSELFGIRIRVGQRIPPPTGSRFTKLQESRFGLVRSTPENKASPSSFSAKQAEKTKNLQRIKIRVQDGMKAKISRYCSLYVYTTVHRYAVSMNNSNFT
jgi:hypothetical protein